MEQRVFPIDPYFVPRFGIPLKIGGGFIPARRCAAYLVPPFAQGHALSVFNSFRFRVFLVGLVLVGATGLVVAWLLNRETASFLDITRTEIAALPPLENVRSAIAASVE
jgi:di/tricarboxylate transporter